MSLDEHGGLEPLVKQINKFVSKPLHKAPRVVASTDGARQFVSLQLEPVAFRRV